MISSFDSLADKRVVSSIKQQIREHALHKVITKLHQSLDLDTILKTTIIELQQILQVDRVGILRLDPDSGWDEGIFIAEVVLPSFDAVLASHVRDHCFGQKYVDYYRDGRIQVLNDVETAGLSDCHLKILRQFQVKANLLVPLVSRDQLWGLMCIHQCSAPRDWELDDIEFAKQISVHLSVAIDHAELMAQTQQQAKELQCLLAALNQAHVQLAQTEKMSGLAQLAAGVAHEINNPATFIQGNLSYLKQATQDLTHIIHLYQQYGDSGIEVIETAKKKVDLDFLLQDLPKIFTAMETGTERISHIVKSLNDFSRPDSEGYKPTNLNQELDNTLFMLQHRLQAGSHGNLQIEKDYGVIPQVDCCPALINQVFAYLLDNAVDAFDVCHADKCGLKTHPIVKVTTMAGEETVTITIHDNGPGISEENRNQLFNPFFTTKPIGQGTGLGLAISYNIITNHGGTLDCQSQLGEGSKFIIELPIHQ